MAPTSRPSTVTLARVTRCTTARTTGPGQLLVLVPIVIVEVVVFLVVEHVLIVVFVVFVPVVFFVASAEFESIIAKAFVDLMNGGIHVSSKVGVGTTFKILLPLPAA